MTEIPASTVVPVDRGAAPLLAIHLGTIAGLFVTAQYSKFVHFIYRSIALVIHASEGERAACCPGPPQLALSYLSLEGIG